jgi:hypothetical protein
MGVIIMQSNLLPIADCIEHHNSINFALLNGYCVGFLGLDRPILPVISVPYKYHPIDNPNRYNRKVYRFNNSYGLSVTPNGRRPLDVECFIIKFYGTDINDFELDYNSVMSRGNLCPWLLSTYDGMQRLLSHIKAMNNQGQWDDTPPEGIGQYHIAGRDSLITFYGSIQGEYIETKGV